MEVHLTSEQEKGFVELAAREGRSADDLIQEALARYLDEGARFAEAVKIGLDAAEHGRFVPSDEVWAAVERSLQP